MMFLKVPVSEVNFLTDEVEKITGLFSYSAKFGKFVYYCIIPTVTFGMINKYLNNFLFNSSAEIIYISEEEAYRMGINYTGDKK